MNRNRVVLFWASNLGVVLTSILLYLRQTPLTTVVIAAFFGFAALNALLWAVYRRDQSRNARERAGTAEHRGEELLKTPRLSFWIGVLLICLSAGFAASVVWKIYHGKEGFSFLDLSNGAVGPVFGTFLILRSRRASHKRIS
jgi:hypothetical protein